MFLFIMFALTIFFLVGTFCLTALNSAFRRIHKKDSKKQLNQLGKLFFYRNFHAFFFPKHEYEGLFFATICAQNIIRFCYATAVLCFISHTTLFYQAVATSQDAVSQDLHWIWLTLVLAAFVLISFILGDYLPRILGTRLPEIALRLSAPFASLFMLLVFPISYLFLKLSQSSSRTIYFDHLHQPMEEAKQELIAIIQKANLSPTLDEHDRKLIESVLTFKERTAREVMVPRVDMFSLSAEISIKEAATLLKDEGYSRIPVYRNSVDNIVGVLMYKDILAKYMEYEQKGNDQKVLQAPIESIQKSVLHTPEMKKISQLLQEFRKRQVHLAIVVDEYGGTEGIVTIEDILEEIVGEIADEYDCEEELFSRQPDGGWVVDARMNILDAEEQLDIKIPQDGEYETIGGYIFHTAGAIPSKGFIIHHDNFKMVILSSNDRCVEKVRIHPIASFKQKNGEINRHDND